MSGDVAVFLWMMVALKIPIGALLYLVWWASREPEPELPDEDSRGGGSDREHPRGPRRPGPPRRGPHADPPPAAPRRTRIARGRTLERS